MLTSTGLNFQTLVGQIVDLINIVVPVLMAMALLLFFVGVARFIYESGDAHGHGEGKSMIIWGLVALFVLVSVWGIINVFKQALFG
jgi:hypothetical protein